MTAPSVRVVEYLALQYRHTWRGHFVSTFVNPLLFLGAMGYGLGSLVDRQVGEATLGGLDYVQFVGPGILAANAMQSAASQNAWPLMAAFRWRDTFGAAASTPITPADLAAGQIGWTAIRALFGASVFAATLAVFGVAAFPGSILAVLAAVLTGLAFAGPMAAFTATRDSDAGFNVIFRFGVTPMFLFSGTFFPISQLPDWLEPLAWATPLWHGVELCRGLVLEDLASGKALGHVAYLGLWAGVGFWLAARYFTKRLWK